MKVFVTGATGFVGSFLVPELIDAGHQVVGLSRSEAGAEALTRAGAEVFRGDVNDLDHLRVAAEAAVATGLEGSQFHRSRRYPGSHPDRAGRGFCSTSSFV